MESLESVFVPDIGDYKDIKIAELLVKAGDVVERDAPLIALETDKATMEVPSPMSGTVRELKVDVGSTVSKGSLILFIEPRGAAAARGSVQSPATEAAAIPEPVSSRILVDAASPASVAPSTPSPAREGFPAHATPSVRKQARELGVDLGRVRPTGPKNRITRDDLLAFVKGAVQTSAAPEAPPAPRGSSLDLLPWPQVDFAKFGAVERRSLSRIKAISGANLQRNWATIPHVTNFEEADVTEVEAFRQTVNASVAKGAVKVTLLAFVIKAAVATLRQFPTFNASLDGDALVLKNYFHIGFAADTPRGLLVPVLRDADRKGIIDIATETAALAAEARDGKLKPEAMQGGCFSVSSLGGIGGTGFTPIINAPEVAILGLAKAAIKPLWDGSAFQPRLILPLSLSWDHRVVDGAEAGRFLVHLAANLRDVRRLLL